MTGNMDLRGKIDIETGPASAALAALSKRFQTLAANANVSNATISKQATAMRTMASAANVEAGALIRVAKAQADVNKRNQEARLVSARATGVNVATRNSKAVSGGQVALLEARAATEAVRQRAIAEDSASKNASRNLRDQIALRKVEQATIRASAQAQDELYAHLAQTRYALYDVSRTLTIVGAAMLALPVAAVATATAWQRDFVNVQRTVGVTGAGIKDLRNSFVDLVQTIPEDWASLTQIGTLAGQLGVAAPQVANFTKITAQFATTSGTSIEETATAFGRLNSLVPDVKGNYQKLADSVLKVGVNSVATEQQILRTATQLSFLGSQTNLTSTQIIGLSGALASVAVSPELSRSLAARLFANMGAAAADGGAKLEEFARISGMSAEQFRQGWSTNAGELFLKFMNGIANEGQNADTALKNLGITSIRDRPALIRLANAADDAGVAHNLLTKSFQNAADASGTLKKQYDLVAGTVSAKLQLLTNNFAALMDVAGSGGLGPIGDLLDSLIGHLQDLTDFAQTDVGGHIIGWGLAFAGLAGALSLLGAVAATSLAGYMALILALRGLQTQAGGATISMASLNGMLEKTGPLGARAAVGIRAIGFAMKGLVALGALLVLPDVTKWAGDTIYDITKVDKTFDETLKRFRNSQAFKVGLDNDFARGLREGAQALGIFAYEGERDLQRIQDSFTELAAAGDMSTLSVQMTKFADTTGYSLARIYKEMPGLEDAFKKAGFEVHTLANGTIEFTDSSTGVSASSQEIATSMEEMEAAAQASADAIKEAADALLEFNGAALSQEEASIKFYSALNSVTEAAKEAGVTIDGTNASSLTFRSSLVDSEKAARDTAIAFIDNGQSVETAMGAYNEMREAVIKEIAAKTGSMDTARAWADRVLGTTDEAKTAMQNYFDKVKSGPTTKDLTISSNVGTVQAGVQGLIDLLNRFNGKVYTATTRIVNTGAPVTNGGIITPGGKKGNLGFSGGQFAVGGYTGDGGKYVPAGTVHRGEFVMTKEAVGGLGTSFLYNLMRSGEAGYRSGGYRAGGSAEYNGYSGGGAVTGGMGSGVTFATLDAATAQAIIALANRPVNLYTTNRLIAQSAAEGAKEQTLLGVN